MSGQSHEPNKRRTGAKHQGEMAVEITYLSLVG